MLTQKKWLKQDRGVGLNTPWKDGKARYVVSSNMLNTESGKVQQVEAGEAST